MNGSGIDPGSFGGKTIEVGKFWKHTTTTTVTLVHCMLTASPEPDFAHHPIRIFSPLFDIARYRRRVSGETSLISPPSVIPLIPHGARTGHAV